jgi:hypothetical protein
MKIRKQPNAFIFEITLRGAKYPVWRIVEVPANISLHELHLNIQVAMGWTCSHLYAFEIGKKRFEFPDHDEQELDDDYPECGDSTIVKLKDLQLTVGSELTYIYDFGDNWEHDVIVKAVTREQDSIFKLPICSAGAMACPPEDIGGVHAYNALVKMRLSGVPDKRYDDLMEHFKQYDIFTVISIRSFTYAESVRALGKAYRG